MSTTRFLLALAATFLVLAKAAPLLAQNRAEYFKIAAAPEADAPAWQRLLYSEDPDVFAVDDAYEAHFRKHPWRKDLHVRNYLYWRRAVEPYVDVEGRIRPVSSEVEAAIYADWRITRDSGKASAKTDPAWRPIGPFATYQGERLRSVQANVYALSVSASDPDVLFAGTEGSGVYRSSDAGHHWELCTATQPFSRGVSAVAIHPTNSLIVLAAANRRFYRTADGGDTWTEVDFTDGSGHDFKFHPTHPDTVFAVTSRGLFRSNDAGRTWIQKNTRHSYDLAFKPGSPAELYLYDYDADTDRSVVRLSADGGETWTVSDDGWFAPADPATAKARGGKLAVHPAHPDLVYASVISDGKAGDNGWTGLYHSADGGRTWRNPAPHDGAPFGEPHAEHWNVAAYSSGYHQGYYNHDLLVAPDDPGKLWMGTLRLLESVDSGRTWTTIGGQYSRRFDRQHADIQDLEIDARGRVWIASDGGIDVSEDTLRTHHESRVYGLDAADFWGFAGGWNEDLLAGGKYHNGNSAHYQTYATGDFAHLGGTEEPTGYTNAFYPRQVTVRNNYRTDGQTLATTIRVPDEVTGAARRVRGLAMSPHERVGRGEGSLLATDVRYGDRVYLGREDKFYVSDDGGASFRASWTFEDGAQVAQFAQSRAEPDVFYVFAKAEGQAMQLYRSADGGQSFQPVETPGASRQRMLLALDPMDADHLWVTDGYGYTVHQSTDGGQAWTDRTPAGLGRDGMRDLLLVPTPEGFAVYHGGYTQVKLYESWRDAWRDFDAGLPFSKQCLEFAPFYPSGKLRMATQGRGVYETQLAHDIRPQALPMTARPVVHCRRDTITLESHSILDQRDGATFAWRVSPAPAWISDSTERRPRLLLSEDGAYDVTLAVTDAAGRTDSRTIAGMITLDNQCAIGQRAGMALSIAQGKADVEASAMRGDSMTVMMWVRPREFRYSMLAMVRDASTPATGIHMWDNGELGVHFAGGGWGERSGLRLDSAAWNHVALTVAPTHVTLYVNGEAARLNTRVSPLQLSGRWRIGGDPGRDSRNFTGDIDELSLWDRPLSREEIRARRHHTLDPATDAGLVHYFQFDVPELGVYDLVGATPQVAPTGGRFEVSDAPVGSGLTVRLDSLAAGEWTRFAGTGAGLRLGEPVTGPVTVTYLDQLPHGHPARPRAPQGYWIVNDYAEEPRSEPFALELSADGVDVPGPTTELLRRGANDTSAVQWSALSEGALAEGAYRFDSLPGLLAGQYVFGTDATFEVALRSFRADTADYAAHVNWALYGYDAADAYTLQHRGPADATFADRFSGSAFGPVDSALVDTGLVPGLHSYRLALADAAGAVRYSGALDVVIAERPVVSGVGAYAKTRLTVAPNPVAAGAAWRFDLGTSVPALQLRLYDVRGREVARVHARDVSAVALSSAGLVPGVYVYELRAGARLLFGRVVAR